MFTWEYPIVVGTVLPGYWAVYGGWVYPGYAPVPGGYELAPGVSTAPPTKLLLVLQQDL